MSAAEVALDNMTKAGAMPCLAPSGTATCPEGRVRIGVFFDGTGNNQWRDWPNGVNNVPNPKGKLNGPTNVAKLWHLYIDIPDIQKRVYHHGVGTDSVGTKPEKALPKSEQSTTADGEMDPGTSDTAYDWRGTLFGAGGKARTDWGLKQLSEFFSKNTNPLAKEKLVESYGFSRGAAISRDFLNRVILEGIDNLKEQNGYRWVTMDGKYLNPNDHETPSKRVPAYVRHEHVIIHFLGAFDTVGSFGLAGLQAGDTLAGYNFFIDHTKVKHTVHMIAEDEIRGQFPVTSLFMDPRDGRSQDRYKFKANMVELWYPGAHSDVGGSYLFVPIIAEVPARVGYTVSDFGGMQTYDIPKVDAIPAKRTELAHIPLKDMHKASTDQGVPFEPLASLPAHMHEIPGDLQKLYDDYDGYRQGTDFGIGKRYVQSFPSHEFHERFYVQRDTQPAMKELLIHFVHDSRLGIDKLYNRQQRTVLFMGPQPENG